jgi:hypothetical protein
MRPSWFHLCRLMGVLSLIVPASSISVAAAGLDGAARARTITYHEHDVVGIQTRLRFTTVIVLPEADSRCRVRRQRVLAGQRAEHRMKPPRPARPPISLVITGTIHSCSLTEGAGGEPM